MARRCPLRDALACSSSILKNCKPWPRTRHNNNVRDVRIKNKHSRYAAYMPIANKKADIADAILQQNLNKNGAFL